MIHAAGIRTAVTASCAAALGVASPTYAQSDETFDIRQRPQSGDAWRQTAKMETRTEGWQLVQHSKPHLFYSKAESTEAEMSLRVGEVDASGGYTRELTLSHLKAEHAEYRATTGKKTMVMDSSDPSNPSLSPELRSNLELLKDVRITVSFDREGRALSYHTDPAGNLFAEQYAASAARSIQQDFTIFPANHLKIGEVWRIGSRKLEGSFGGPFIARVEYDLSGKLIGVESRGGARHALILLYSTNPRFEGRIDREFEGEYPPVKVTMTSFDFNLSAEYDLDKGRFVKLALQSVLTLATPGLNNGPAGEIKLITESQEAERDAASWMIDGESSKAQGERLPVPSGASAPH